MTATFTRETDLLTSSEAADLLRVALTGDPEVVLPGFTTHLDDLHYRPGSEVTAIYTVTFEAGPGQTTTEHLLATTAEVAGQVATLSRDGVTLRVWRHPADPRLPGLAPACDPATVLAWLATADPRAATPGSLQLDLLSYRPLRRAVLRAVVDGEEFFLKVMRPGYDDRLATRQQLLAGAGLTVPVLARPAPGVLLSSRAAGESLAGVLVAWQDHAASPPTADDLLALLDRLPPQVAELPKHPSWSGNLAFHAATARQQLPADATRVDALVSGIQAVLDEGRHGPEVPTHGDFYEANLFTDGQHWQFIDIDSVGPGLREDDLACCLAHLAALPPLDPTGWRGIPRVVDAWQRRFEEVVDPADLRARVAGVLLSLVSGAESGQDAVRLALAEQWLASAREIQPR
ncbi:MAG: hypothetical protein VB080_09885 [Propionicimonas sp.]|uniref:hypothetical protein n=1 Tax=Propionicimonas sp. TaxID=1955623 RepID=UPI002B207415|nr:hypothetical protein [Propionicimonas sp.]MEA4944729.1 hypothetical protein [Propionicimonas sp.]MEA5053853.1 hypothetical protein [Propionicimonas sp.]